MSDNHDPRDARGRTPLMRACRTGDLGAVRRLIDGGADVNAVNHAGTTPLMYAKTAAVGSGDVAILDTLIAAGADVNAVDAAGRTALDYLTTNAAHVISYLKSKGAK